MSDRHVTDQWIDRVRDADAEAEARFQATLTHVLNEDVATPEVVSMAALIAIAAELRAQRIARRPGAGQ